MADTARVTRQREAIFELLGSTDVFMSATRIHSALEAGQQRIALATVYRALQTMAEDGAVDVLRRATGETLYRRCEASGHHHHLVCRSCGKTVEVAGPSVESWAMDVAHRQGFSEVEHTLEVSGLCSDCQKRQA